MPDGHRSKTRREKNSSNVPQVITAQQIKDGTVPGLKYGPKKTEVKPSNYDKEKSYTSGDYENLIFTNYKNSPQGLNKLSKQAKPNAAGSVKLPSDSRLPAQKEDKKADVPKHPPMQDEK